MNPCTSVPARNGAFWCNGAWNSHDAVTLSFGKEFLWLTPLLRNAAKKILEQ
jgi:hypothetical protein